MPICASPFFTGVVFLDVCNAGGLPPEGVVEVGRAAAGLAVEVFRGVVFAAAGELLAVLEVGGRVVTGRDDVGVPGVGLKRQNTNT